jgi:predicted  nucleic acid-binding Zn-ribbon protein
MVAADSLKLDFDQEKLRLQGEEKKLAVQKNELQDRVKEIDDRLAQLNAQRAQIVPAIEPAVLKQYERILSSREGLAIVMVKDNSCQGCNMSTPPQVINLIRMYDSIITCEVCNRILYIE